MISATRVVGFDTTPIPETKWYAALLFCNPSRSEPSTMIFMTTPSICSLRKSSVTIEILKSTPNVPFGAGVKVKTLTATPTTEVRPKLAKTGKSAFVITTTACCLK